MPNNGKKRFKLEVPLDASEIEDFSPEQKLKVVAEGRDGVRKAQTVQLDKQGNPVGIESVSPRRLMETARAWQAL